MVATTTLRSRVLHINEQRTWRGGEQQMFYLTTGLHKLGAGSAVAVQPGSPAAARLRNAGVAVHEMPMHGELDLVAAFRLARIVRAERFNILHAHTAHAHSLAMLAAHVWRAPARVVVHRRIAFPVGKHLIGMGRLKYRIGVDAFVAVSNRVKETLVEAGVPEWRIFPVHSSTSPDRFLNVAPMPELRAEFGIPPDAFVIGNIGALVGHKDHFNLLNAMRLVCDHSPNAWCVIVGEGPLHETLIEKVRSLDLQDRVVLTGFRHDIPELIRMFDMFALSSWEEGICSTLLDVAVSDCPIVATDAGGVREAVLPDETGLIVPIRNPRALADAILRMARNPDLAQKTLAVAGKSHVLAQFTAETMTERTLAVYERVLARQVGAANPVGYIRT